jgi:hypothetical protein
MGYSGRVNALDQQLDIQGSQVDVTGLTLTDEANMYGTPLGTNSGTASVTVGTPSAGQVTISGMTGGSFTANSVGDWVTFAGFSNSGNNGNFLIVAYVSATSVTIANTAAVAEGPTASVTWVERYSYSLLDDLNYERSDRQYIKGVAFSAAVPTYFRPTAETTAVPANLANIASKTTDAVSYNISRGFFDQPVGTTSTILYASGQLHHSQGAFPGGGGDNNFTGVPCFDDSTGGPFNGDWNSCYVEVTDYATGNELYVQSGAHTGEKIFGLTVNGSSTSPNSVQVNWYSCPSGENIATSSTAYTWEKGSANSNTGTTPTSAVTVAPGSNGASAISGITGATFTSGSVGNWVTFSGFSAAGNNGTFLITTYTSATSITVFNPAAVAAAPNATAVTWQEYLKSQPDFIDVVYGYNERLDTLDINAFRFPLVSGLTGDADLRYDVNNLKLVIGVVTGNTSLAGYLTNTGNYFPFSFLGTATPSVVQALNTLNQQIGNMTFTGSVLGSYTGGVVTAALQLLANAIGASTITRMIERLASAAPANTAHTLPGGATYVLDGSGNGKYLWLYWRGILRDPGTVATGDDYAETSTTSFTPYSKIKAGDHINYFIA